MRMTFLFICFLWNSISFAQIEVKIPSEIRLPKDSIQSQSLINSLNQFLEEVKSVQNNDWVYSSEVLETSVLLDELKEYMNTPLYLNTILPIGEDYLLQLSAIETENQIPLVKAYFELVVHQKDKRFWFSSPLIRNTKNWKTTKFDNFIFHYTEDFDEEKAKEFQIFTNLYDSKLGLEKKEQHWYLVDDDISTQKLIGLPYSLSYNGENGQGHWYSEWKNQEIHFVNPVQIKNFDPHDLWHYRLRKLKSRKEVNHAVDEAIATLYGGSWGLTWKEMFEEFLKQIQPNRNTDWLQLRKDKVSFETKGHQNLVDFMITALLVQKVENERGFQAVWRLLNTSTDEHFFKVLEEVSGISKKNYNKEVWKLVSKEMQSDK